jgi:hypothetical protein
MVWTRHFEDELVDGEVREVPASTSTGTPIGYDSKLFSPLWTDFLPRGQKCHFRRLLLVFNVCHSDASARRVTKLPVGDVRAGVNETQTLSI